MRNTGRYVSCLLIKVRKDVAETEDNAQLGVNKAKDGLSKAEA